MSDIPRKVEINCGHHHTRRADAALRAAAINEGLLHGVQLILVNSDAFDGFDRGAFGLCDWHQTTVDNAAVEHNRARTALAFAATFLRTGQAQLLAQHV